MDKTLIDTDIYSEIGRARNPIVLQHLAMYLLEHGQLTIAAPTIVELAKGLVKARRFEKLALLAKSLDQIEVLSLDRDAAQIAGEIYGKLELAGTTIGRIDPMIAAIAIQHDRVVVTGNIEHFARISHLGFGLRFVNWRE